jgi:hypothetical protein
LAHVSFTFRAFARKTSKKKKEVTFELSEAEFGGVKGEKERRKSCLKPRRNCVYGRITSEGNRKPNKI